MTEIEKISKIQLTLGIIGLILLITSLIEIVFLIYFWNTSDIKECNWLWCTFGKVEKSVDEIRNYSLIQECYINNIKVNCSEIVKKYENK